MSFFKQTSMFYKKNVNSWLCSCQKASCKTWIYVWLEADLQLNTEYVDVCHNDTMSVIVF